MNEKNLSACDMLLQMIERNNLSATEEARIRKALNKSSAKREDEAFRQYASQIASNNVTEQVKVKNIANEQYEEFFIYSKKHDTRKYASLLRFEQNGIRFIENPYTLEETEAIKDWMEDHPDDIRGLAAGLWLSGGITPQAILNLRTDVCWNIGRNGNELLHMYDNISVDRTIFQRWDRFRIVKRAMEQHRESLPYIFMVYEKNNWHKLNGNSIQIKMYHICQSLDIPYKGFSNNEIILFQD